MRGVVALSPEHRVQTTYMAKMARAVLAGEQAGNISRFVETAPDIPEIVKKAITAPMLSTDTGLAGLANTLQILTSFAPLLRSTSVLFRLLDGMMRRVPLQRRLTFMTGSISGVMATEGQAIPVSRMTTDTVNIAPVRSSGIVAFSKEFLQLMTDDGEAFLSNEIRRAIVATADAGFLDLLVDGDTPTATSVGSTALGAAVDLRFLFNSVELTAESKPLLVLAPDVARKASTLYDTDGGFVFPDMGPTGGTMCKVPAMVSDALLTGEIALIDGASIAGDALGVEMNPARHATLEMSDAPDSPASASTTFLNLWQSDLIGFCPTIYFGAARTRDNAIAKVTGISWGSTDSPA